MGGTTGDPRNREDEDDGADGDQGGAEMPLPGGQKPVASNPDAEQGGYYDDDE